MIVSSQQPLFLPWIGFWNKLLASDLHVISAGVRFTKRDVFHRIRLNQQWVTLSVLAHSGTTRIHEVGVQDLPLIAKRLEQDLSKRKHKFRDRIQPFYQYLNTTQEKNLLMVNHTLLHMVLQVLNVEKQFVIDQLAPDPIHSKTENLFERIGRWEQPPYTYLAGSGALCYLKKSEIPEGVTVWVQKIEPWVKDETILQLIATEEHPLAVIQKAASWEPL